MPGADCQLGHQLLPPHKGLILHFFNFKQKSKIMVLYFSDAALTLFSLSLLEPKFNCNCFG